MSTVAERIETAEQHKLVRALGVTYPQGYLLGRPAAAPSAETRLLAGLPPTATNVFGAPHVRPRTARASLVP